MKVTSRVVFIKGKYKGKTGTIIDYKYPRVYVELDHNLDWVECKSNKLLEIDDITNIGNIKFKKNMKIYDVNLNKVGKILDVYKENKEIHKVKFECGKIIEYTLKEDINFIILE
ncbi:hypothetical protein [Senegalia massiliensis]|uniref:KOW domain-containing protein n=1 Tax=Senegalia massiliensis TaxID=1720316 RepID=A0A845QZA3_9CLOT|nr:hypothetical protein [Senegalia massiliensis]NBI07641.1 hypothetical protein [Senegalia massiliensis]